MPQPPNSYAKQPTMQKEYYDRTLLERLLDKLVWFQFAQKDKKSIPKNEGDTIDLRKYHSLPPATTPLVEGITPAPDVLTASRIRAVVKQYGKYVELTDKIQLVGLDPVVSETLKLQGEQAGLTLDLVTRDVVCVGTNVYYVGGGIQRADVRAVDIVDGTLFRRSRQIMARNNVQPVPGMGSYIVLIHPDVAFDLTGSPGWVDPSLYAGSTQIFEGELGKLHNHRFIECTTTPIWPGEGNLGADVYGTIVLGAHGFGTVDIGGKAKPETIVKPLGHGNDPLNQRSTCGWKALFTTVRLEELAILRIESGCSIA